MIVGIIPARGGSKGIPRKNLIEICGKPLIFWSIEAAKQSQILDDVFVSTDDDEISDYCLKLGVNVLRRPKKLAGDDSTTIETLNYHFLNEFTVDTSICTLQPTSPIRLPGTLDQCVAEYQKYKPFIFATGYQCKIQEFGVNNNLPRQQINGFFYDDGNIYIHSPQALQQRIWSARDAHKYFTQQIENYEIDTEVDLKVAGYLLEQLRG